MMLLLAIIIVIVLFGGFGYTGHRQDYYGRGPGVYYGGGGLGFILIIFLLLWLVGFIRF